MPRSHVSVARFYDWSGDVGDCFSVSRLYREIANTPQAQTIGQSKGRINLDLSVVEGSGAASVSVVSNAPNRPPYNSPGRMFVRDKKAMTRGEREIIEGIYKNRSDLNSKDPFGKLDFHVKSHQEAWQAGKNSMKNERLDGKRMMKSHAHHQKQQHPEHTCNNASNADLTSHTNATVSTGSNTDPTTKNSSRLGTMSLPLRKQSELSPRPKCTQCELEQRGLIGQDLAKITYHAQNQDGYWDSRPCAPPSTPDRTPNSNGYFRSKRSPSFDKLMSAKPNSSGTTAAQITAADSHSATKDTDNTVHQHYKTTDITPRDTSNIQKTLNAIQSVLEENAKLYHKQNSSSSGFHSEFNQDLDNGFPIDLNSNHESKSMDSSGSECGSKKVKVKVYLPIAHHDATGDDDVSELLHH